MGLICVRKRHRKLVGELQQIKWEEEKVLVVDVEEDVVFLSHMAVMFCVVSDVCGARQGRRGK